MNGTQGFETGQASSVSPTLGARLLGKVLTRLIRRGTLTLIDHKDGAQIFGVPEAGWPDIVLRLTDGRVPIDMVRAPDIGTAEAYMDGRLLIETGDIMGFLTLIQRNNPWEQNRHIDRPGGRRHIWKMAVRRLAQANPARRSRRNVAHHYDLDGGLYALFLDSDRQYSCAYFARPDMTLEEAQEAKKAHIAAKLALAPGQRVLDIGCGWGGMALYLHRHFGVEVTGITLSTEQLAYARARAEAAGVADKVRFEMIDYRAMSGQFDRIVSVGMFEHVGVPNFREFFRICRNLLAPDGVMLLHTIGRVDGPNATDAFTRKYIFPGGYIPALSEVMAAAEPNNLMIADVEILRLHYAKTLHHWYDRTFANRDAIEALYDARFFRLWAFYLAGAATAFEFRGLVNFQLQFVRDRHALPITRDYMLKE